MIKKFTFGDPFPTDAVVTDLNTCTDKIPFLKYYHKDGYRFIYPLEDRDIVYGLGENTRGINKRGYTYTSLCSDDPHHTEDRNSLYAAHNFLLISGKNTFGIFIDCPEIVKFDIGYTDYDTLKITTQSENMDFYIIEDDSLKKIVHAFREMIGKSYIPPKWGFGYQQSRWGYSCEEDFYEVANQYEIHNIPLESIYMDIDYMERYKDFTVDRINFPHFQQLVENLKYRGIKLVPIIDAGVKIEKDYDVYEEGIKNNYFCQDAKGSPFVLAVWPGRVHFPDVLNPEARAWFGSKYKYLTDMGIEGFWNDMNEPAIFYTEEGLTECFSYLDSIRGTNIGIKEAEGMTNAVLGLANNPKDYKRFYHNVNGKKIVHSKLHNLYGYYMTRAAAEGLEIIDDKKRFLLFSRSSYVGMHRYGGVWTGDNSSWWSHLLLNIKMMPSLNMCGFLYAGADIGGFGSDTSYDLMVRWLQFGIFTPLMRNHACKGTREQELYQFKDTRYFSELINFRYSLIPYLYTEYMKAAINGLLLFSPLEFEYPNDEIAANTEDELILGESLLVAPVYIQNAIGRTVYLPEEMLCVTFKRNHKREMQVLSKGHHFIKLKLEEFPIFIRKNCILPLCKPSKTTETLDSRSFEIIGFAESNARISYKYYDDDGYTKNICLDDMCTFTIQKENGNWNVSTDKDGYTFFDLNIIEAN